MSDPEHVPERKVLAHELPAYFHEAGSAESPHSVGRVRLLSCVLCGATVPVDGDLDAANRHIRWHVEATPPEKEEPCARSSHR